MTAGAALLFGIEFSEKHELRRRCPRGAGPGHVDGMILLKTERDLEAMRPACQLAGTVLEEVATWIQPGATTREIDEFAAGRIKHYGAKSAFLGYRKYPCNICISVNEQVVHGLAGDRRVQFGDIVSLDVGVVYNGFIGDTARTVAVGGCDAGAQRLMDVTERALSEGISAGGGRKSGRRHIPRDPGLRRVGGLNVVREFVGHGVGRSMHEEPQVPNFADSKPSPKLRPGMTLAIEPMVNEGVAAVRLLNDGWTVVTQDGKRSAHFEHTVLVTEAEPEILTCLEKVPLRLKVEL
jgi:methionyl aminopeptidase